MCGITGFFIRNESTNIEKENTYSNFLTTSIESLKNRGPDNNNKFYNKNIGLGHTRLSIIDPFERSNQPYIYKDWILVFNGEIYNYKTIKNDLKDHVKFETNSDTEVLIKSIDIFGIDNTLEKICGMYAFAAFNQNTQELFLVRDHIGMKPLFYYIDDNSDIFFASTPIAIVKGLKKKFDINHDALASYFILGANFMQNSIFNRIYKIEPATYLKITKKNFIKKKYWEPKFDTNFGIDDLISICLEHENSDVKSSIFLSGGVDSSFLTSISRNDQLSCIHLKSNEQNYANAVAEQFNKELIICKPGKMDLENADIKIAETYGEPLMSAKIPYVLSSQLKNKNIKMALSANGADELLFGYSRTPYFKYNQGLPFKEAKPIVHNIYDQLLHIFRSIENFDIEELNLNSFKIDDIYDAVVTKNLSNNFDKNALARWIELKTYVQCDLNQSLDAASMANSVEIRTPFLDKRIISGLLSKSIHELIDNKYGRKKILKKYLSNFFPSSFFLRRKEGFSLNDEIYDNFFKSQNKTINKFNKKLFLKNKGKFYERDEIYLKQSIYSFVKWKEVNNKFLNYEF